MIKNIIKQKLYILYFIWINWYCSFQILNSIEETKEDPMSSITVNKSNKSMCEGLNKMQITNDSTNENKNNYSSEQNIISHDNSRSKTQSGQKKSAQSSQTNENLRKCSDNEQPNHTKNNQSAEFAHNTSNVNEDWRRLNKETRKMISAPIEEENIDSKNNEE